MSDKYISMTDVEVTDITVRISVEDVLGECTTEQLLDALIEGDDFGDLLTRLPDHAVDAFLEECDQSALVEALDVVAMEEEIIDKLAEHDLLGGCVAKWVGTATETEIGEWRAGHPELFTTPHYPLPVFRPLVFNADGEAAMFGVYEGAEGPSIGYLTPADLLASPVTEWHVRLVQQGAHADTGVLRVRGTRSDAERFVQALYVGRKALDAMEV